MAIRLNHNHRFSDPYRLPFVFMKRNNYKQKDELKL
jgi:hypothetical protein